MPTSEDQAQTTTADLRRHCNRKAISTSMRQGGAGRAAKFTVGAP